ncbi:hypothetical protein CSUI_001115, partial [Cystoisospora suis]
MAGGQPAGVGACSFFFCGSSVPGWSYYDVRLPPSPGRAVHNALVCCDKEVPTVRVYSLGVRSYGGARAVLVPFSLMILLSEFVMQTKAGVCSG